jgi:Sugar kinases, ribokinase family
MDKKVVTLGEVMMRLSPTGNLRFRQTRCFNVNYGGGEINVAVSLANYGVAVDYVTRVPENEIGDACLSFIRQYGVGIDNIIHGGDRLGIYFLEMGAAQRGSKVIYDRSNSAFAAIRRGMIDWQAVFSGADWFHWTGITPAVSESAAEVCYDAVLEAKKMGLTVSCDLNYRGRLWKWGKSASEVMPDMIRSCDIVIGNEEDAEKVFGIKAPDTDVTTGSVSAERYSFVCRELAGMFPSLRGIAITLRGSISANYNTWSGILWDEGKIFTAPVYHISNIVDRVGAGDAFVGALIYALKKREYDKQQALNFAVASSCLKHSVFGDFNLVSVAEVEKLLKGDGSGRVVR